MNVKKMMDLTGRVAVVTGGYGIYGGPISEAIAEAGAHVVIASRSVDNSEKLAAELRARGLSASAGQYDQAKEESIKRLRDSVMNSQGRVDILVNNAVLRPMRAMADSIHHWRQSMDVNATGLFTISRAFLEPMIKCGCGTIINIGSIQSVRAPRFSNYADLDMTTPPDYHFHKHGLIGLTKYLAAWAGPHGVRVNAISPGGFQTPDMSELFVERYRRQVFLGRLACHDDIKGAVVFLASDAAGYITGHNLIVDGGYTC